MKTATISEAKNGLSALLERVNAGESVLITDRGVPVARIEPVSGDDDPAGQTQRLVRAGILRLGTGKPPVELTSQPGAKLPDGVSAVQALLEERESGW